MSQNEKPTKDQPNHTSGKNVTRREALKAAAGASMSVVIKAKLEYHSMID